MNTIDDCLERLSPFGPEFRGGLSNHAPMAADALIAMGRDDAVQPFTDRYIARLAERPRPTKPIDSNTWREALGDYTRVADWEAFFERELAGRPWRAVVAEWTAHLAPGFATGATHGLLRTAHAVRGLAGEENDLRRDELARGLAYWAARFLRLPEKPSHQRLPLPQALAAVPIVPPDERRNSGLITQAIGQLADREDFHQVANTLDVSGNLSLLLGDFTAAFAGYCLENMGSASIAFIHCVTAPSAIRLLAPHIPEATTRELVRYGWQAGAAILAVYSQPGAKRGEDDTTFAREDLIDRAVASGDEHAIKFTDACLREHDLHPNPVYLAAAADVSRWLRA